jgi:hypothetical protein
MKPDAGRGSKHMDLVVFVGTLLGVRFSQHSVYSMCTETSPTTGSELFCYTLYLDWFRNGGICRKSFESYPDSLWTLVRDIYNTVVRKE